MNTYYIYIMASKPKGTIYIGVTNNPERRVYEHKSGSTPGFTKEYNVNQLVYFEEAVSANDAISREKQLKNWHRQWKINLIEFVNENWKDLSEDF
jgi:putative endonuclease